jgi:hypothetical protein
MKFQNDWGYKVNIVVRWGKNDVEKLFRRPKVMICSNA